MKKNREKRKFYLSGLNGEKVKVSEKIFREYKHSQWNENAQIKREHGMLRDIDDNKSEIDKREFIKVVSLDSIVDGGGDYHIGVNPDFSEELVNAYEEKEMLELLGQALETLENEEKELIDRLFYKDISEREYERKYGTPRKTVAYRKNKTLAKLKKYIDSRKNSVK